MTLHYDVFNHLVRVVQGNMVAVYDYRADGLRHSKTVNGHTTTHVWDRGSIILEMNGSDAVVNRFSRGLGHLIHSEHHGFYVFNVRTDVIQRVDANGAILHTYRYDAFGNQLNGSETNTNPFRFAAEYYDWETGFIYLRARYLNPAIGRFISEDPYWTIHNMQFGTNPRRMNEHLSRYSIVPDAWVIIQAGNLFVYTANNPVLFVDPTGHNAAVAIATNFLIWRYGPAVRDRVSVEVSYGLGAGGSVRVFGLVTVNLQGTTRHFVHTFSSDGIDSRVGMGAEASVDILRQINAGAGIEVSSPSTFREMISEYGSNIGSDRETEWFRQITIFDVVNLGATNVQGNTDRVISVGTSLYALVGGGIDVSFNLSEFQRSIRNR